MKIINQELKDFYEKTGILVKNESYQQEDGKIYPLFNISCSYQESSPADIFIQIGKKERIFGVYVHGNKMGESEFLEEVEKLLEYKEHVKNLNDMYERFISRNYEMIPK